MLRPMSIPESQLETWAKQGAGVGSASTYASAKSALEGDKAQYTSRDFKVFLQGSYGNDTNIYAESDVDVVIRYDGAFYRDLDHLSDEDKALYLKAFESSEVAYKYSDFKKHAYEALVLVFGTDVKAGNRAIKIKAKGNRRNADVVVAFEHRRYWRFKSHTDCDFYSGITFFNSASEQINNFPKFHSDNATSKHGATSANYKPMVRIFKNMRSRMVEKATLADDDAPSYFIEGLLYNVPNDKFSGSYSEMVYNVLKWLSDTTDRSKWLCVNERYYLAHEGSLVCWSPIKRDAFINAVVQFWNDWGK